MAHTYEELKKKTVAELREIASGIEHEAVQGYTQMNKDHLLKALCNALGIDMFEHHVARDAHKSEIKANNINVKIGGLNFLGCSYMLEESIIRSKHEL